MDQPEKPKQINLPDNLKSKLLKFRELQEQLDSQRKKIQSVSDKDIKENEPGKENNSQ